MKTPLVVSAILFSLAATASAQAPQIIRRGNVLSWSASSGHAGLLKIVTVEGAYFEAEQTNDRNPAAGVVRFTGAVIENGQKVVLISGGQWKEVWEGRIFRDEITGTLNAGSSAMTFKISAAQAPAPMVSRNPVLSSSPFVTGRTLRWNSDSNGGQSGTFFVVSGNGPTFVLDQSNVKNPSAGVTRMDGEIKDGMVYIYNRKWKETWVGIIDNGRVKGRVNNGASFRIFE